MATVRRRRTAMWPRAVARWVLPTPSEPVITATVPVPDGGPPVPLLIDGTHRLYKAAVTGRTHLPSLVLTLGETRAIRCRPRFAPAVRRQAPARGNWR